MEIIKDILTSQLFIGVASGLLSGFLGYSLGNRSWKKQFFLKHFNLHEKVLHKISAVINDEIEGFYFLKKDEEIKKIQKDAYIMTADQYFSELAKDNFDGAAYPSFLAFGSIKDMMGELKLLSTRSNNKISKIIEEILSTWDDRASELDENVKNLADCFNKDPDGWDIPENAKKYIDYFEREHQELILLQIVPLINKLKLELKKYLKNKE